MHNGVKKPGRNRSPRLRTISDDYYTRLACAIVHSGIMAGDVAFLTGEWCEWLLEVLGVSMSGIELLIKYRERTGGEPNGKR